MAEYMEDTAACRGIIEHNRQTSSRAAASPATGDPLDCGAVVGVVVLNANRAGSANQIRRPYRRHRTGPRGFLSAAQVAERADAPLSSVYNWLKSGRLGKPHRWRNLLVVSEEAADEFLLTVRPVQAGAEGGAND